MKYTSIIGAVLIIPFFMMVTISTPYAKELEKPQGNVILTISGKIANKNTKESAEFSAGMLKKLGLHSFKSTNNWIAGEHIFEGIKIKDLMTYVGAMGTKLYAVALNDYSATIPLEAIIDSPALVVLNIDGEQMSVREKGPLWILYPQGDGFEKYQKAPYTNYMVWQLRSLEVR